MKTPLYYLIKILSLIIFFQVHLASQNVGIGTNSPTAKLHLQSSVQTNTSLDLDFETGTIDPANNLGDNDWYITSTDGYNSAKSVKAPLIFNSGENALLAYDFNMSLDKEITVSFDYKFDDPTNQVSFLISANGFSFVPPSNPDWKSYSTSFISQQESNVLKISVNALVDEAFPIVHIDNITITYSDGHVLKIEDGTEGEGRFLQSDALGHTEWYDLRAEVNQQINNKLQDLTFDSTANELSIEEGNSVPISGLKNSNGNSMYISGLKIIGSDGMSMYLPGNNATSPSFHFDAENETMDWGLSGAAAKGSFSTRWGNGNTASNSYDTSWGEENVSSGGRSTSWGQLNWALGELSTSWGYLNTISGQYSTAWGRQNQVDEIGGTAWGILNTSSGLYSTVWGDSNEATEENSTSWGLNNQSTAELATTWGEGNIVTGQEGTAWGTQNLVDGSRGTAWGVINHIINGASNATACGYSNDASGNNSFVSGFENEVNTYAEVAFGRFNNSAVGSANYWHANDVLFSLGNGVSNALRSNALTVMKNGNVGIGIDNPSHNLHLENDSAAKPGTSSWTVSSDRRLKKDISQFTDGLDIISAIEPVWFTYNGLAGLPDETFVGTIAQDLEAIAPYMVTEYTHRDDDGNSENYKAVNYGAMDFVLINAIKEQQAIIQLQQETIANQQAQIDEILRTLNKSASSADE